MALSLAIGEVVNEEENVDFVFVLEILKLMQRTEPRVAFIIFTHTLVEADLLGFGTNPVLSLV